MRRHIDARLFVLLLDAVPAALRRRLVEKRVAFISPGAQFYVPEAFVDLRETYSSEPGPSSEQVSPTTQVVILAALLGHDVHDASLTQLADRYQVAIMSMSRAFDELEALELARPHRVGRQRRLSLRFGGGDLWRAVEGRLQSPVRKTRYVTGNLPLNEAVLAGESALARYTMLNEPRIECRAAPAAAWKRMARHHGLETAWAYDEHRVEVQTWAYDPQVLSDNEVADRLSLYLSARHDADERVAQAADHLLEPFGW
jgi:DNA-binding MarR family transcriptional regulator